MQNKMSEIQLPPYEEVLNRLENMTEKQNISLVGLINALKVEVNEESKANEAPPEENTVIEKIAPVEEKPARKFIWGVIYPKIGRMG